MYSIIGNAVAGIIMMLAGAFIVDKAKKATPTLMAIILGVLVLGISVVQLIDTEMPINILWSSWLRFFPANLWIIILMQGLFFIYLILMGDEVGKVSKGNTFELFALLFFIMAGVNIICSYNNLLMLFLGIEIVSIPLYILSGSDKLNLKSNEAALKYFLMGSFSTGIMLMGIALIYCGSNSGSLNISDIKIASGKLGALSSIGLLFIIIAMSFKVSAAPFHFWTPDVYDGAPTVFTGFMASIVKASALYAFVKLFLDSDGFYETQKEWQLTLAVIIALTLIIGNITAVFQQSVKRMLSYSSIAQAGFLLFSIYGVHEFAESGNGVVSDIAQEGFVIYAVGYCLASIGLFAVLLKMKDYSLEGFRGLGKSNPVLAVCATIFLLSLTGIPATIGFQGKFMMLIAAIKTQKFLWLVILAVLAAAVSAYYYLRVIQNIYFKEPSTELGLQSVETNNRFNIPLIIIAALIILLGILPSYLSEPLKWVF